MVAISTILLSSFGNSGVASASAVEPNESSASVVVASDEQIEHFTNVVGQVRNTPELGGSARADAVGDAYDRAARAGTHLRGADTYATGSESARQLPDGGILVALPVHSSTVALAWVAVVTSRSGAVTVNEYRVRQHDADSAYVQAWTNGALAVNAIVHSTTADFSWSKFNNCLSGAGVASWLVAAIGIACIAACVGTAGAGCVACAAAAAGVAGGTIGYCVQEANK